MKKTVLEILMYTLLNCYRRGNSIYNYQTSFMWRAEGVLELNLFNFSNSLYFGQIFFFKNTKCACFRVFYCSLELAI